MSVPCAVVGQCTSCENPWLDIRVCSLELCCCKRFSLKSPSIAHGILDIETWFSSLDRTVTSVAKETLGDLYNNAICMGLASCKSRVVHTASMPLE